MNFLCTCVIYAVWRVAQRELQWARDDTFATSLQSKERIYRRVKKNMNCNPAPVCIAASQLLRQAQTRLGSLNFCLIWMGQVIWSDYVYIAFSLCEKNTFLQECIWEMFFRCEYIVFFLDLQMRCDVCSGGVDMFLKWGGNMEAIPRLMTSHQVNLCEAIITLCLDELRRIFRQQKKASVYVGSQWSRMGFLVC